MLSVEPAPGSDLSEVLKCGRAGSVLGDQPWVSHGGPAGAMRHWSGGGVLEWSEEDIFSLGCISIWHFHSWHNILIIVSGELCDKDSTRANVAL